MGGAMNGVFTIDVETSIKNRGEDAIGTNKAAPWHPDNKVVLSGSKQPNTNPITCTLEEFHYKYEERFDNVELLIGHNIKFDLHYYMKTFKTFRGTCWPTVVIWDTQLAEYLLTGQQKKYAKLDDVAVKYGGVLKDDRVKAMWEAGVDTEDMDRDLLDPYLKGDLDNTELVFLAQIKKAKELGMFDLCQSQMKALKATTEMEWNGMYFDKTKALDYAKACDLSIDFETAAAIGYVQYVINRQLCKDFNPFSNKHVALALFGGNYTYKADLPVLDDEGNAIRYKTGKRAGHVKTKKGEVVEPQIGYGVALTDDYRTPKGIPKVDNDTLTDIMSQYGDVDLVDFCGTILKLREYKKDASTYYRGYAELVWPNGIIHQSLNHVSTETGRLSCTKPNLQNVTSAGG